MAHPVHSYRVGDEPVPGYRVVSFLGRGGFGEVWKASAPGKTDAALKMIDLRGSQGAKEFDSLRLVKRIHHPNLIPVQAFWLKNADGEIMDEADAGWADATLAGSTQLNPEAKQGDSDGSTSLLTKPVELVIAMGLGQKSLFNRLREAQNEGHDGIPVEELLDYMEGAAQGIEYLNASFQIVHGDIKPHNILVVGNAAAVCDFGLARAVENLRKTATTSVTVAYAAPEALRGRPSLWSDQYSLAITYVELRTGRLPFDESLSCFELMNAHVNGTLDLSALPKAERDVIQKAILKDPEGRWPTTRDMVKALRRASERPARKGFSLRALFGGDSDDLPNLGPRGGLTAGATTARGTKLDSGSSPSKTMVAPSGRTGSDQTQAVDGMATPPSGDVTMAVPDGGQYQTADAPMLPPAQMPTQQFNSHTPVFSSPPMGSGRISKSATKPPSRKIQPLPQRRGRKKLVKISIGLTITFALLAAGYWWTSGPTTEPQQAAGSFMVQFDGHVSKGEFAAATDLLDKGGQLELSPDRLKEERERVRGKWNQQALEHFAARRWDEARQACDALLARFKGDSPASLLLVRIKVQQDIEQTRYAEAFDQLNDPSVAERIPDGNEKKLQILAQWVRQVETELKNQRLSGAQQQIGPLLQRYPADDRAKSLGVMVGVLTQLDLGKYTEAFDTLQKSDAPRLTEQERTDLRDQILIPWLDRAEAEYKTGQKTKAEEICDLIIARFPGDVKARALRATIRGESPPVTPDELIATIEDFIKRKRFVEAHDKLTSAPPGLLTTAKLAGLRATLQKDWLELAQSEVTKKRMIEAQILCSDILERFPGNAQALSIQKEINTTATASATVAVIKSIKEDATAGRFGVALEALDKNSELLKAEKSNVDTIRADIRTKWLARARDEFKAAPQEAKAVGTCKEVLMRFPGDAEALLMEARYYGRLNNAERAKVSLDALSGKTLPDELTPLRVTVELLYNPAEDPMALLEQMKRADEKPVPRESAYALDDVERESLRNLRERTLKAALERLESLSTKDAKEAIVLGSSLLKLSLDSADSVYSVSLVLVKLHFEAKQYAEARNALASAAAVVKTEDAAKKGATLDWQCRLALADPKSMPEEIVAALADASKLVSGQVDDVPAAHQHLCTLVANYTQTRPEHLNDAIQLLTMALTKSPMNPEISGLLGGLMNRRVTQVLVDPAASKDNLDTALQDVARLLGGAIDRQPDNHKGLSTPVLDLVKTRRELLPVAIKALRTVQPPKAAPSNGPATVLLGEMLVLQLPDEIGQDTVRTAANWKSLREDCELALRVVKPPPPVIDALRLEAMLEADGTLATSEIPAADAWASTPYMHYVRARALESANSVAWDKIVKDIQSAYPTAPAAETQVPHRKANAARLLVRSVVQQRPAVDSMSPKLLFEPFGSEATAAAAADGAFKVLSLADQLSQGLPEKSRLTGEESKQLQGNRALAAWYKKPQDVTLVAKLPWSGDASDLPLLVVQIPAQEPEQAQHLPAIKACSKLVKAFQSNYPFAEAEAGVLYDRVVTSAIKMADAAGDKPELATFYGDIGGFIAKYRHTKWSFEDKHRVVEKLYDRAIALNKDDAAFYIARGTAKIEKEGPDFKGGLEDVDKAMRLRPDLAAGHDLRGQLLLIRSRGQAQNADRITDLNESIAACSKALKLFQSPLAAQKTEERLPTCLIHLSQAYLERANYRFAGESNLKDTMDDLTAAIENADTATRLEPRYPEYAYWALGNAREDVAWLAKQAPEDNYRKAIEAFSNAIAKREDLPQLWVNRARCYYKAVTYSGLDKTKLKLNRNPLELCIEDLQQAIKLPPPSAETHLWLGRAYLYNKQHAEADKAYEAARKLALEQKRTEAAFIVEWIRAPYSNPDKSLAEQTKEVRTRAAELSEWRSTTTAKPEEIEKEKSDQLKESRIIIAESFVAEKNLAEALKALENLPASDPPSAADANVLRARLTHQIKMTPTTEWQKPAFYDVFVADAKRLTEIAKDDAIKAEGHKFGAQARANRTTYGGVSAAERLTLRNETILQLRSAIGLSSSDPETWRWQELLTNLLKASLTEQTDPAIVKRLGTEAMGQLNLALAATKTRPEEYDRLKKLETGLRDALRTKNVTVP